MNNHEQMTALILLESARSIITTRRKMEEMCTWPPEYGGDQLLLDRLERFLKNECIKIELADATSYWQEMQKKQKKKKT